MHLHILKWNTNPHRLISNPTKKPQALFNLNTIWIFGIKIESESKTKLKNRILRASQIHRKENPGKQEKKKFKCVKKFHKVNVHSTVLRLPSSETLGFPLISTFSSYPTKLNYPRNKYVGWVERWNCNSL